MTEEEHERLDGLMSPLFDIRLKKATGTDSGGAFACLVRHIIDERIARKVGHMTASVMEYAGVRAVRYEGMRERYDRIPKGAP